MSDLEICFVILLGFYVYLTFKLGASVKEIRRLKDQLRRLRAKLAEPTDTPKRYPFGGGKLG